MLVSKISSKGQTVLPRRIREQLNLTTGSLVSYEVDDGKVILRKVAGLDSEYYRGLELTLSEWGSKEDDEAFHDL